MKRTLLILCWIYAWLQAYASFGWKEYTVEDGVFSSEITALARDQNGFLWVGSSNGLYKFNGYHFEHYRKNKDSLSLASNEITGLETDENGNLWVFNEFGIQEFSRRSNGFLSFDIPVKNPVKVYFDDSKGVILIENRNIKIIRNKFQVTNYPLSEELFPANNHILHCCKYNNTIILADSHNVVAFNLDDAKYKHMRRFNAPIKSLVKHMDYAFLISGSRLYKLNALNTANPELIKTAPHLENPLCLFTDDIGNLWLAGENGLYLYDENETFELKGSFGHWLDKTVIKDIYLDENEIVWIASSINGLLRYDLKPRKIHVHPRFGAGADITSVKLVNGNTYVVDRNKGIYSIDSENQAKEILKVKNAGIFDASEGVLALSGKSIYSVKNVNQANIIISNIPDSISNINDVIQTQPNEFYIATAYGVWRKYNERYDQIFNKGIQTFLRNGTEIYAGGESGIFRLNLDAEKRSFQALTTDATDVSSFCKRGDSIYVGVGHGLFVFWFSEGNSVELEKIEEFSNNAVLSLGLDQEDRIWAATYRGLYCYNPANGKISYYGKDDGLPSSSGINGSLAIDENNKLFLGSQRGLFYCNLDSIPIKTNDHSPETYFESIIVRNGSVPVDTIFSPNNTVSLDWNDHVNIEFNFFTDDFTYPQGNKFRYKLAGYDNDWVWAGNSNKVVYYGLKPGKYLFQLQGSNSDDTWSIGQKQYSFEIESGFFAGNMYKFIIPVLFALAAYLIIQYRTRKLRYANVILKEKDSDSRKISQQKEELTIKNKNITDSINYAKRIQEAMLPTGKDIREIFPESFILFMPKDIVSGDFYWVYKNKNKKYIAAVDCTGHGVPGAFMSIVGVDLLRNFSQQNSMKSASEVLDALNKGISDIFKQKGTDSEIVTDGMDISLCIIDEKEKKLEFSGAHHSLYLIRNNNIRELKGDRFSIGSGEIALQRNFTNQSLDLKSNDMVYMFTDGYVDQFGGEEGKKYKYRRFRYLLLNIHRNPLDEQHDLILNSFLEWKKEYEQVDDILIVGFKPLQG